MPTDHVLEFDIVVVTRNRQPALRRSIPLMLSQSRLPCRLIVVDSSDDHSEVREIVECAVRDAGKSIDMRILQSRAGMTYQRNIGLSHVQSPIVFFPDDDAMWSPGLADAIMRIYERDAEQAVGCVGPYPSPMYPHGISKLLQPLMDPIEKWVFVDPMQPGDAWMRMWGTKVPPNWFEEVGAELVGVVAGYGMTFRTELIRNLGGFDENLGRYSLFEDCDATIGILKTHMNVCAKDAHVLHDRAPGKRQSDRETGIATILNTAYIVCKHSKPGSIVRRKLKRFLYYRVARYFLQARTEYGRDRLRGALYALSKTDQLLDAPPEELLNRYLECRGDSPPPVTEEHRAEVEQNGRPVV